MKTPHILTAESIRAIQVKTLVGGQYVAARPATYSSITRRLQATWLVLTGKADAVIWERSHGIGGAPC